MKRQQSNTGSEIVTEERADSGMLALLPFKTHWICSQRNLAMKDQHTWIKWF